MVDDPVVDPTQVQLGQETPPPATAQEQEQEQEQQGDGAGDPGAGEAGEAGGAPAESAAAAEQEGAGGDLPGVDVGDPPAAEGGVIPQKGIHDQPGGSEDSWGAAAARGVEFQGE